MWCWVSHISILAYPYEISLSGIYNKDIWIIFLQHQRLYITYHSFDAIFWFFCSKEITRFESALGFLVKWRKHWILWRKVHWANHLSPKHLWWDDRVRQKKSLNLHWSQTIKERSKNLTTVWNIWHFLRYKFLPDRLDVYLQRISPSGWLPPGKESILRVTRK